MRRTFLAFFGLIFVGYWLWTADGPSGIEATLEPVLPSVISPLPKSDLSGIRHWLIQEAMKINKAGASNPRTVMNLKKKALSFKSQELRVLKETALSPTASGDERFLAVYIIGLSESSSARELLKEIAEAPVPTATNERAQADESVIRANALEAVVRRLGGTESKVYLENLLARTKDPMLARQTRYWLSQLNPF